jgi:succinoglycan biosynthesis transport protein ExoP
MLQINDSRTAPEHAFSVAEFLSPAELYAALIGFLRRQYLVIALVLLCMLAIAAVYIVTSPPRYTAHAVLVIDTHKTQVFQPQTALGELPIDSATVDTQIEILNSEKIALSVIKDLRLYEDPEFISPRNNLLGAITGFFNTVVNTLLPTRNETGGKPATQDYRLTRMALQTFQSHLKVKRVALTYAIDVEFQSISSDRAAQIANALADAYVVEALDAKFESTRRAAVWLQDRLKELREEAANAERAVVDYKSKNNIVDTGGRLMNEQQLAELNSQLIQARAQTTEAKARLDRVQEIIMAGDVDPAAAATATVTDSLRNEVINRLRQQYLDFDAKASLWTAKYGATHMAVVNLHNQMRELRRTMFEELRRIAETYKSEYEIAKTREDSVQQSLNRIVNESQTTNELQIVLHNLESSAQTYRALYDNFLQRYMESVQQQSFPVSDSRLITQASRPLGKSSPKPMMVLALATLGGLILGAGIGILRDISDRVFRTTAQVAQQLQTNCISVVPLLKEAPKPNALARSARPVQPVRPRTIVRDRSLHWTAIDAPLSRFAESIRAIKVAADLANLVKANKVIGITSSLPNEGKSTIAMSLAQLIAHGGGRVILLDCDLRNPSLSRKLARTAKVGLLEVIAGQAGADGVLWIEPTSGFTFLPATMATRVAHSSEILASEPTRNLFGRLRESYDYVIVDLPPLAPVVDVRVMTNLVDSFAFVVEWGRTKIDVAEHALDNARGVYDNLLGVVLNKADMSVFGRYENHRGNYYYNRYYSRYGYTD